MDDIQVLEAKTHVDARGWLQAGIEAAPIAYVYATTCLPGVVKGWHRHARHTDRLMCVAGLARITVAAEWMTPEAAYFGAVARIGRDGIEKAVKEYVIGPLAPKVVVIPPGWWHAFQAVGGEPCVIVNAPDMAYDPGDQEEKELDKIPFEWGRK